MLRRRLCFTACSLVVCSFVSTTSRAGTANCGFDFQSRIENSDNPFADRFGWTVAMDRDVLVAGVPHAENNHIQTGAAYVFRRSNNGTPSNVTDDLWSEEAILMPDDAGAFDDFGAVVAVDGDTILVASPRANTGAGRTGAAYIFRHLDGGTPDDNTDDEWAQEAKLVPAGLGPDDYFGDAVAVSGEFAVIGAIWNDERGMSAGVAHVYRRDAGADVQNPSDDTWAHHVKLFGLDTGEHDQFGDAVAISESWLIVGASTDDVGFDASGSAYVFYRDDKGTPDDLSDDQWIERVKLVSPDPSLGAHFGSAVSLSGDRIVVGAPLRRESAVRTGVAYVFRRTDPGTPSNLSDDLWSLEQKLTVADVPQDGRFGHTVGISGDRIAIGAHGFNGPCVRPVGTTCKSGSVFLFHLIPQARGATAGDAIWTLEDILVEPSYSGPGSFGWAVTIAGTWVGVGKGSHLFGNYSAPVDVFAKGVDCNNNGVADGCDVESETSDDCDGNFVPDECDVTSGHNHDCNKNGALDSCDVRDKTSTDCNSNIIPDECDLLSGFDRDCNNNETLDYCDIRGGTSDDCNRNLVPDSCELADGSAEDCDANGQLDICAIEETAQLDCNENGALDSCSPTELDCNADNQPDACELTLLRARFTSPSNNSKDQFGAAVAASWDWIVVGAPEDDEVAPESGAVYLYLRDRGTTPYDSSDDDWTLKQKIPAPNGEENRAFGLSAAITNDRLIVGAPYGTGNADWRGAAYVFVRDDAGTPSDSSDDVWVPDAKLTALKSIDHDIFGFAVALVGDVAVVGVLGRSAYVFRYDPQAPLHPERGRWLFDTELLPEPEDGSGVFGASVSIDGRLIAIGDPREYNEAPDRSGAVHVFHGAADLGSVPTGWSHETRLTVSGDHSYYDVGSSVSLSRNRLAVGGSIWDGRTAFMFRREQSTTAAGPPDVQWALEAEFTVFAQGIYSHLGSAAVLDHDRLAIGVVILAPSYGLGLVETRLLDPGALWFDPSDDQWRIESLITEADAQPGDYFATSMAMKNDIVVIGSGGDYKRDSSVYVFAISPADCNRNGVPDSCDIGSGESADLNTNGLPDECESHGNCDSDSDVDEFDVARWLSCLTGPDVDTPLHCACADLDGDNDVDLRDISTLTPHLAP